MTIGELRLIFSKSLSAQFKTNHQSVADEIISDQLNFSKEQLLTSAAKKLDDHLLAELEKLKTRLLQGEPLAHVMGYQWFYEHKFKVGPQVLIPRMDSECLIDQACVFLGLDRQQQLSIMDLGTGSGCLGLSLLMKYTMARLTAVDVSAEAIGIAKQNANLLGCNDRACFIVEEVKNLDPNEHLGKELVIANPPYIGPKDYCSPQVKMYEPHSALFANDNGYKYIKEWAQFSYVVLAEGGALCMEVGDGQAAEAQQWLVQNSEFQKVEVFTDLANNSRGIMAYKKESN